MGTRHLRTAKDGQGGRKAKITGSEETTNVNRDWAGGEKCRWLLLERQYEAIWTFARKFKILEISL